MKSTVHAEIPGRQHIACTHMMFII